MYSGLAIALILATLSTPFLGIEGISSLESEKKKDVESMPLEEMEQLLNEVSTTDHHTAAGSRESRSIDFEYIQQILSEECRQRIHRYFSFYVQRRYEQTESNETAKRLYHEEKRQTYPCDCFGTCTLKTRNPNELRLTLLALVRDLSGETALSYINSFNSFLRRAARLARANVERFGRTIPTFQQQIDAFSNSASSEPPSTTSPTTSEAGSDGSESPTATGSTD